jgi:hypothetical protein
MVLVLQLVARLLGNMPVFLQQMAATIFFGNGDIVWAKHVQGNIHFAQCNKSNPTTGTCRG